MLPVQQKAIELLNRIIYYTHFEGNDEVKSRQHSCGKFPQDDTI